MTTWQGKESERRPTAAVCELDPPLYSSTRRYQCLSKCRRGLLYPAMWIWLVSCTFLTSPDNSDHLPHSSFLFPELNWTWASVLSLLLHPSFGMNSQPYWNLVKVLPLSVKISNLSLQNCFSTLNSRRLLKVMMTPVCPRLLNMINDFFCASELGPPRI